MISRRPLVRQIKASTYPQVLGLRLSRLSGANCFYGMASLEALRERWNRLYRDRLPSLARAKDPSQTRWPVHLDHCFARIILDAVVGKDKPWTQVLKSPAYKNMGKEQLEEAITLGERLATGEEDLVALDEKSLALRVKMSKQAGRPKTPREKKRKVEEQDDIETQPRQKRKVSRWATQHVLPEHEILKRKPARGTKE